MNRGTFFEVIHRSAVFPGAATFYLPDSEGTWKEMTATVQQGIGRDRFADGLMEAIDLCGDFLAKHFPKTPADTENEVSDDLIDE